MCKTERRLPGFGVKNGIPSSVHIGKINILGSAGGRRMTLLRSIPSPLSESIAGELNRHKITPLIVRKQTEVDFISDCSFAQSVVAGLIHFAAESTELGNYKEFSQVWAVLSSQRKSLPNF